MRNLIKSKVFIATFLLTYFTFLLATGFIPHQPLWSRSIILGYSEYGFPFAYYISTCFGSYYSWQGLLGNILFAFALSFVIGIIFSHFWLKISSSEFRAKWYLNK